MDTTLPPDFRDFLRFLRREKVEYLLVGSWAVGVHGHPRNTADIDIWAASGRQNAEALSRALQAFGFSKETTPPDSLLRPHEIMRIGEPPLRIDILTSLSGVEFGPCFARKLTTVLDGVEVNVIGKEDLLANKRAAGRLKDLADVEALE